MADGNIVTPKPYKPNNPGANSGPVSVSIEQLEVGRELTAPIYDSHGILLLAVGCVVTIEQKLKLVRRGISQVIMSPQDIGGTVEREVPKEPAPPEPFHETPPSAETAERLAAVIGEGIQQVVNQGDPVKDAVKRHGMKHYDSTVKQNLDRQYEQIQESVTFMLSSALGGNADVDVNVLRDSVNSFIDSLCGDIDASLSKTIESARDDDLVRHALNTAVLSMAVGVEMGMDGENINTLGLIAMVHDWGMARVPLDIRNSPRVLSEEEKQEIRKHPDYTIEILAQIPELSGLVRTVAYQIHERPDGTGYPRGLRSNSLHQFSHILNVADTYLALVSQRPHRAPLMGYAAVECMLNLAQNWKVDPDTVRALLRVISLFPIGSYLMLTDGSVAQVLRSNKDCYTKPIVKLTQSRKEDVNNEDDESLLVDLSQSKISVLKPLPTLGRGEIRFDEEILDHHC